jgi:hypothetical protein
VIDFVLVEQRSARLPVTQEIVGSNPIGDAVVVKSARYANRQSDQVQTLVFVGSIPSCAMEVLIRVGWGSVSPTACKAATFGCAGSIPARRTWLQMTEDGSFV